MDRAGLSFAGRRYRDFVANEAGTFRAASAVNKIVGSLHTRKITSRRIDDFWLGGNILPYNPIEDLFAIDSEICNMFHEIEQETDVFLKEYLHIPVVECSACEPDSSDISASSPFPVSKQTPNRQVEQEKERKMVTLEFAPTTRDFPLPEDFQPLPYSVILGKASKDAKDNIGNRRLRVLASTFLSKYADASNNKTTKSRIVSSLLDIMYDACPVGAFIRLDSNGRWRRVSDSAAREKVGYTLRELLGEKYKSSSKAKAAMRSRSRKVRGRPRRSSS